MSFGQDLWQKTNGPYDYDNRMFEIDSLNNLYMGSTFKNLTISNDSGKNWNFCYSDSFHNTILPTSHSLFIKDGKTIFVSPEFHGVYRSEDAGKTWKNFGFSNI